MKVYKALQGVLAALVLFLLWTTPAHASSSIESSGDAVKVPSKLA